LFVIAAREIDQINFSCFIYASIHIVAICSIDWKFLLKATFKEAEDIFMVDFYNRTFLFETFLYSDL